MSSSSPQSLSESPQYIQFPIPFLAQEGGEEGDGIGDTGSNGGDIGKPEEVRRVMTEVIGELLTKTAGRVVFLLITTIPHYPITVLQVPADRPYSRNTSTTLEVSVSPLSQLYNLLLQQPCSDALVLR